MELSHILFLRYVRQFRQILTIHDRLLNEFTLDSPVAGPTLRNYEKTLQTAYSNLMQHLQPYLNSSSLPDGLTEECLDDTCMAVQSEHQSLMIICQSLLDHIIQPLANSTQIPTNSASVLDTSLISMPKLELKHFDGQSESWPAFEAQFKSLVIDNPNISTIQKFQFLLTALDPNPLKVIEHLPLKQENFQTAFDLLQSRYHNPRKQISTHCNHILQLPTFDSKSISQMRSFLDIFQANYKALINLQDPNHLEALVVTHIVSKLDSSTRIKLESHLSSQTQYPSLDILINFLTDQVRQRENLAFAPIASVSTPVKPKYSAAISKLPKLTSLAVTTASKPCSCCNLSPHPLHQCQSFLNQSSAERHRFITSNKLCYNCLRPHQLAKCVNQGRCHTCGQKHHTLLHRDSARITSQGPPETSTPKLSRLNTTSKSSPSLTPISQVVSESNSTSSSTIQSCASLTSPSTVLLSTCLVRLQRAPNHFFIYRALLDSASQSSFISEQVYQDLRPPRSKCPISISGIGTTSTQSCGMCWLTLTTVAGNVVSQNNPFIILPKITTSTPSVPIDPALKASLSSIILGDPSFDDSNVPISVLIGSDLLHLILQGSPIPLGDSLPLAIPTIFGHVLLGPAPTISYPEQDNKPESISCSAVQHPIIALCSCTDNLNHSLQNFWQIEEPPTPISSPTDEELRCEEYFKSTVQREPNGRYIVRLPFKISKEPLGDSKQQAILRFNHLERKFTKSPRFKQLYTSFMQDYLDQGHMRPVQPQDPTYYFIPHHGIFKTRGDTDKIRVVFDASATTSTKISLNDILFSGPKLQPILPDVITLFRRYPHVFTTDICQMFRQIALHPSDHPYQCILWRSSPEEPLLTYYLTTVTYGLTCAPYLALRILVQLVKDEGSLYPLACQALTNNTFVDDIVAGADTIEELFQLKEQLITLLGKAQFSLKKWSSNNTRFLSTLPKEHCANYSEDVNSFIHSVLGLVWSPTHDCFHIDISLLNQLPSPHHVTKRQALSFIAKLFDPCGWISPIIMVAKVFIQALWLQSLDWDDLLPESILQPWNAFIDSLNHLSSITISRPLITIHSEVEIHGFSDASQAGLAACVYIKSLTSPAQTSLIISKTRVAPIKVQTLPRLELMAAHLLAQLISHYLPILSSSFQIQATHLWSDSTITLTWLKQPPIQLKTFIANRVSFIQSSCATAHWHYVPSKDNPADIASRGTTPLHLSTQDLWWHGPSWLRLSASDWPPDPVPPTQLPETVALASTPAIQPSLDIFQLYSSWPKLLNLISRLVSWKFKTKKEHRSPLSYWSYAEFIVFRHIQKESFPDLPRLLASNKPLPKSLQRLAPFLDQDGLIKIRGRMPIQSGFSHPTPILLPKRHNLVNLYIDYHHLIHLHAGTNYLFSHLSPKVWILSAKQAIKSRISACHSCFKFRPTNVPPKMANLPINRVTPSPPFHATGLDFAGPFNVKLHKLRKAPIIKVYLCLFVCFATRAVHLELAPDLSTHAFLTVLQNFISRRSAPAHIHCDNGTNFTGAAAVLHKEWLSVIQDSTSQILSLCSPHNINFHFIPPAAPHQGGLWERVVKSVKTHLYRTIGSVTLTSFELSCLFTRIEAVLNSRPLAPMSSDTQVCEALTPGHFLVGRPLLAPATTNNLATPDLVQHFNLLSSLTQSFWRQWYKECLPSLYPRTKWLVDTPGLQIGDLVLLHEPNAPPLSWPLARIVETFPASDGIVRRVRIKTASGAEYLRPAVKVYPLPRATQL